MIHCIPNWTEASKWCELSNRLAAAFEYNEFFLPTVLDDKDQYNNIVNTYLELDRDRSKDTLHGAFLDIVLDSSDSLIRQASIYRVKQCIETAYKLGARGVVFHTNYIVGFKKNSYRDRWVNMTAEFYRKTCSNYSDMNIFVENMFDDNPELIARLGREMKDIPNFGICFDIAHAYLWEVPLDNWVSELGPYVKHIHINDNLKDEDSHLALGEGSLPLDILNRPELTVNNPSLLIEVKGEDKFLKSYDLLKEKHLYPFIVQ